MHISFGPSNHLEAWLQEDSTGPGTRKIIEFVRAKCEGIFNEWVALVSDNAFHGKWQSLTCDLEGGDDEDHVVSSGVLHTLEQLTDYYWRCVLVTQSFPHQLLLIVVRPTMCLARTGNLCADVC